MPTTSQLFSHIHTHTFLLSVPFSHNVLFPLAQTVCLVQLESSPDARVVKREKFAYQPGALSDSCVSTLRSNNAQLFSPFTFLFCYWNNFNPAVYATVNLQCQNKFLLFVFFLPLATFLAKCVTSFFIFCCSVSNIFFNIVILGD